MPSIKKGDFYLSRIMLYEPDPDKKVYLVGHQHVHDNYVLRAFFKNDINCRSYYIQTLFEKNNPEIVIKNLRELADRIEDFQQYIDEEMVAKDIKEAQGKTF